MSIASIISTATTGLSVSQTRIALASANIANAETIGYTAKTAKVATQTVGGQGTGVQIVGVGSDVDAKLHQSVVNAISTSSYDATIASYLETISSTFGTTEDGADLTNALADLQTALSDVIADPADTSAATALVDALSKWGDSINAASDAVQSTRTSADQAIAEDVESVNKLLYQVDDLNDQITRALANGSPTSDLEDQRRAALESLGQHLSITTFTTSSGATQIYTSSGQALLTSHVNELSYAASGVLSVDSTYPGSISGITVGGKDVTGALTGGSIGALVTLRDKTLPGIQDEVETLSNGVMDTINAAANAATPVPAPNSVTSTAKMTAADAFAGTGTLTVLLTDADGKITGSTDLDLTAYATVGDLLTDLNGIAGISATLDADGHLAIAATDADAGLILTGDGTSGAKPFNQAMGFYDVLTLDYGDAIDFGRVVVADGVTGQGIPVASVASTTIGDSAYAVDDTAALKSIYASLTGTMAFGAAGNLSGTTTTPAGYATQIIDDLADRSEQATTKAASSSTTADSLSSEFSNAYGVNVDEETARLTTYQQDYAAAAQILTTAQDMWNTLISMMR